MDTPAGRRPVHVPAKAFVQRSGEWLVSPVDGATTAAVLRAEAEVLDRDGGVLLPASLGMWEHETSGVPVLVMERLEGERPTSVYDVRAALAAVADAVDEGTFEAHGDLKLEHVFIDADGRVRICDPAPRFTDPALRAFTPAYNPRGWSGPAADTVACASMLRYLRDGPGAAAAWADELLGTDTPPGWATDHRQALARLDALMEAAASATPPTELPPDPGSSGRRIVIIGVTDTPDPFPPYAPTAEELAVRTAIERVVVGAVDVVLGQWAEGDDAPPTAAVLDVEVGAVQATLASVLEPTVVSSIVYGADAAFLAVARLFEWGSSALETLAHPTGYDVSGIELRLPQRASEDAVRAVLEHTWDAYLANRQAVVSSEGSDDEEWGARTWRLLLERGYAAPPDLAWAAASLVAELALVRRAEHVDQRGSLAMVLDELGAKLLGGIVGWEDRPGASVSRPLRYRMRTLFDGGSGAMVWSASDPAVVDRWDHWVDHFDLPIPLALAARVQRLVDRHDLTIPVLSDYLPFGPGEREEFVRSYHQVCDDLERALGSAYVIETRMEP